MSTLEMVRPAQQKKALWFSTFAFTMCFAVWTIFAIIGVQIKTELGLNQTQFGLLVGLPILTGSLSRLLLGIWTDQYGGRKVMSIVMILAALATFGLSFAETYAQFLVAALGVGLAGGSFAAGVAYVSRWYPKEQQGTSLGIFGMGNVGAAVTKLGAPFVMVALGWESVAVIWAALLGLTGVVFFLVAEEDPVLRRMKAEGRKPEGTWMQLSPLARLQVWRFALYYFFVFGAFVALALWLPHYYVDVYHLDIKTAGVLAALFSIPASIFRAAGGWMSDKWGARRIMYATFTVSVVTTFLLSYPSTSYVIDGIDGPIEFSFALGFVPFTILTFVLGFFMSLGKAAVYKHIPVYYPDHVGSVGGMVGMIGGLGGFILPLAFGALNDLTGIWTSSFMLLFVIASVSLLWMHLAIRRMERRQIPQIGTLPAFPELQGLGHVAKRPIKVKPATPAASKPGLPGGLPAE